MPCQSGGVFDLQTAITGATDDQSGWDWLQKVGISIDHPAMSLGLTDSKYPGRYGAKTEISMLEASVASKSKAHYGSQNGLEIDFPL